MPANDVSIRIGGEAGQGVESSGTGFAEALTRGGVHVFAEANYRSRIRGGHNFFTVRAGSEPVYAVRDKIQVLIALTAETVELHINALEPGGAVIVDPEIAFDESILQGKDVRLLRPPLLEIAGQEGNRIMSNTGALAYVAGLIGLPLEHIVRVIERTLSERARRSSSRTPAWPSAAMTSSARTCRTFAWQLQPQTLPPRMTITGNSAFSIGALMAVQVRRRLPDDAGHHRAQYMSLHGATGASSPAKPRTRSPRPTWPSAPPTPACAPWYPPRAAALT